MSRPIGVLTGSAIPGYINVFLPWAAVAGGWPAFGRMGALVRGMGWLEADWFASYVAPDGMVVTLRRVE